MAAYFVLWYKQSHAVKIEKLCKENKMPNLLDRCPFDYGRTEAGDPAIVIATFLPGSWGAKLCDRFWFTGDDEMRVIVESVVREVWMTGLAYDHEDLLV